MTAHCCQRGDECDSSIAWTECKGNGDGCHPLQEVEHQRKNSEQRGSTGDIGCADVSAARGPNIRSAKRAHQ